jgi:NADPH-dependent curcumin reductase CurA
VNLYPLIQRKRLRIEGFSVWDLHHRYAPAFEDLLRWFRSGDLTVAEHIVEGMDSAPSALIGLLEGHHPGKVLVHVGA